MDMPILDDGEGESSLTGGPSGSTQSKDSAQGTKRGPVTVLFVDLCGYTSLSESLDPEDLRDVMTQVFGTVARVIAKYEGHIDKLLGDAALVLFGVPHTHEDDAVRAIKAAREIHESVEHQSPRFLPKSERRLVMHSAISTGVVLTTALDLTSTDSAVGDTVNLASRLLAFAAPGEVVCSAETEAQAQGYFDFESLGPKTVRGRNGTVEAYRVGRPRDLPITAHRLWGVRSKLIGRRDECARLREAVHRLQHGETMVIAVRGGAGTGKSRLVEEFRDSLEPGETHWLEASSQPYSQNIPYHPFIESIGRAWGIGGGDPPEVVRQKVEANVARFEGVPENSAAYVGALFGLDYPELRGVDSESWKNHLLAFVRSMLLAEAKSRPTVIYLGDLHWADPSSLELLHYVLKSFPAPALFIVTYRPPFTLFDGPPPAGLQYQEIGLRNLSASEATDMLASLLDTETVPGTLRDFLQEKAEGNPFYIEELINSLVESGSLVPDDGSWAVARPLDQTDLPLTVVGVLSARLDRLRPSARRVLQQASVIGRSFPADVLRRVTTDADYEECLSDLQKLDLIRVRALDPGLEYEFKHVLIQEVAYSGLLKMERRDLHEKVGVVLESTFSERLPELYETLALHFSLGTSTSKAVGYLVKSAEKSLRRYAVGESHEFYRQAFETLVEMPRSPERDRQLIHILNGWAYVIYDRGDMAILEDLLVSHTEIAESLGETQEYATWCISLAIAKHCREKFTEALGLARRGLDVAESIGDEDTAAWAHVWLSYGLSEIGQPDEAIVHAKLAIPVLASNPMYITEAYSALGFATWTKGDAAGTFAIGEKLMQMGRTGPNTRATVAGHWVTGEGFLCDGDFEAASKCFADSIEASPEPWPSYHPRVYLAISYIQLGRYKEAEPLLESVLELSRERGADITLTPAIALLGVTAFAQGQMSHGMKMLDEAGRTWRERHALLRISTLEAILGQVYLNIVSSKSEVTLGLVARNFGFLVRNVLSAASTSETHFKEAILICEEIGARGSRGEAYLGLSKLYKATRKEEQARECVLEAVDCFQDAGIKTYLNEAEELLASLA